MRSMMVVGLLVSAMALTLGGCCCFYNPCAQGVFDCGPCGGTCGGGCGSCGGYCGADCGTCDGCSGPPCCGIRPVRWVFRVLGFQCAPACTGCGEEYWGDWCSNPPDCCDPCDQCGNYVGPQGPACASGQCADPGYAAQPRTTRTVAKAPRRPSATLASQRVVQQQPEPEVLSESDEAIEPVSTTTDWQARRTRPAAIQR